MSHRGRLNVLANVLQKSYKRIFNEFAGELNNTDEDSAGDVKYHLGASSDREFDGNSVHVSLTDNPSHLEAVNPVVLGQTRAKQFFHKDTERNKVIPILTSLILDWPPIFIICSKPGIKLSPPSKPNLLEPTYLVCRNFSNPSA